MRDARGEAADAVCAVAQLGEQIEVEGALSCLAALHVVVDYFLYAATVEIDRQLCVVNFGHGALTKLRMRDVIANGERADIRNVWNRSWVVFRFHPYPRALQTLIRGFGLF